MSVENVLRLLALRHRVIIVNFVNDGLYEGFVEDVPRDLWDLTVSGIAPAHDYDGDYLWIEVL